MKKKYSDLLRDKYIEGKKVAVIAAEKGRTVKAIESDLFRAREEFRVLWAAEYGEWL
jgi:DNA-directed RNA polymerase specialized sigma24 family protein